MPPPPLNADHLHDGCVDKNCDIFVDISIDIDLNDIVYSTLKQAQYEDRGIKDNKTKDIMFMYKTQNTNTLLQLVIAKSKLDNITVNIHNILGEINKSVEFDLGGSDETLNIDISDLPSGTYICSVISDGIKLGTSKFLIVR